MQHVLSQDKEEFLKDLEDRFHERLDDPQARAVSDFARAYYATMPLDDLYERHMDDIYGATLSLWHFINSNDPKAPKVRVYNPGFESHGWQSTHTVIEVLQSDMPFLVDSVRIELNYRNITVHAIHNAVLDVERDDHYQVVSLKRAVQREHSEGTSRESVIYIEIDRHSNEDTLDDLADSIESALGEVHCAVSDFDAMRTQAQQAIRETREHRPDDIDQSDAEEACAFLEWLMDDRFTFLGYEAYDVIQGNDDAPRLERVEGSELGVLKLDRPHYNEVLNKDPDIDHHGGEYVLIPELVSFAKSAYHARVHRPTYPDYITIERFDDQGRVIGQYRFLGLYTLSVYNESPRNIPVLRRKIETVMAEAGVDPRGHNGKQLMQILEVFPRDDLFQMSVSELCDTAMGILSIRERRRVRLFIREDRYGKFYSCLVFIPRDVFTTDLRIKVQDLLCHHLDATFGDFNTYLSESVLARVQLILRFNGDEPAAFDLRQLENKVIDLARSWRDELHNALVESMGEEKANRMMTLYSEAFPAGYRDDYSPRAAVLDINYISEVEQGAPIAMSLYRLAEEERQGVNLKIYHAGRPIPLSDVLPLLENMGLRVLGERPYGIERSDQPYWIHDFDLEHPSDAPVDLHKMRDTFKDAFTRIWTGNAESDPFNRLIIAAELDWREVALLRGYARYLKQIRFGLSQLYIANTLTNYPGIARKLVALFHTRFDPAVDSRDEQSQVSDIEKMLDDVSSLNDDRLFRRYIELIQATLRTNFYQSGSDGQPKDYISFKLEPRKLKDVPKPRPLFEIFVYSPRMEGVHLRGGKVARGGMRWSDRFEDFRTEILGLVKAQQVKNAVIVPVGAKGGFVCKRLPEGGDRDAIQKEGIACYQTLIRGMLDITDNLKDQSVVPPKDVVRHDEDDPYLVVAADKGTATFSDIANALSEEYGFWLGDAFASGGEHGYDHKKMAITARGAWESVKRHFRELGHDTQSSPFSVLGIGDMAGDVFGNGMLLSEQIELVAAFNHRNIFIDPNPDIAESFKERKRLFELDRSSWDDYNKDLISQGGGIFSRDAKSVEITAEMKERFGFDVDRMSPTELIQALLKSHIDLIWNGGIGTYIKASDETHADVGDKSNDTLRVDGDELHCKVIGEGGNLGVTQRGRREAARHGVRVNTDFIDNAGGVNCSDHEVNLKILLDDIVRKGDMTDKQRNELLLDMTEEVGDLVIRDNYRQTQALSLSSRLSQETIAPFRRFIHALEQEGVLDRELEGLPDDEELEARAEQGEGLTHPELSVLISYAKSDLKIALDKTDLADNAYIERHLENAFPATLKERFKDQMYAHRLKKEIVATQVANDVVDHMGIPFVRRMMDSSNCGAADVVKAYVIARDSFQLPTLWQSIESLDYTIDSDLQYDAMLKLMSLVRRATRWFLHQGASGLQVEKMVEHFGPRLKTLRESVDGHLRGEAHDQFLKTRDHYVESGVPEDLASTLGAVDHLYAGLGIIESSREEDDALDRVARTYYLVGEHLELPWMIEQIQQLDASDGWEAMAREALRDDMDRQQLILTSSVLRLEGASDDVDERIEQWLENNRQYIERWRRLLEEVHSSSSPSFALFAVAVKALMALPDRQ
ncbi:NAD-glutamate dehydrogenase [Larsenimonas rhizosphaerae]|uniref:NAD-glutamate dehydrogenase n=1 Tax=Larsenimonas rhizosphaerae TaxID=2944682 RepID=UPI002034862B|nr:NAD-glutamate dehydrogenase [Larsenimonas rhizosphaerae]MCM2132042.1 NAD-glutamate dehydrogenase [Larsenimonas rhizosphaerae]